MNLLKAGLYTLFAGRGAPQRSLKNRIAVSTVVLALLAYVVYRVVPTFRDVSSLQAVCLICVIVYAVITAVYVCTTHIQRGALQRLRVFLYLPLGTVMLRRLLWMAYIPVILLSVTSTLPLVYGLFHASLGAITLWLVTGASLMTAVLFHTMVRTTRSILGPSIRLLSSVSFIIAVLFCWQLVASPPTIMSAVSIVVSALVLTAVSITLYKAPLLLHASVLSSMVRKQWRLMSVGSALFVRACRSPHYIGANFFLAGLLVCASCLAWFKPALPFDAVCVLVLLLVGTLGQEARSIGKKHVPVELVLYGAKRQWVGAIWQLTLINAAFFTALMLVIAILWFPHDVGAGYMQIVCTAIFLAIGGLLAASLIVPHHDDIVMQLLSMALYGAFGWAILHILADKSSVTQAVITGLGVMCGFLLCYWCESLRWVIAIRGKYAFSRR